MASLLVLQWNARGVRNKPDFANCLALKRVDVAVIQESHLSSIKEYTVKGYNLERCDGPREGMHGVVTMIKHGLNYTREIV